MQFPKVLKAYFYLVKIIYNYQSGFRSSFSTDTCLIHLLDYIKNKNVKGLYTGMVLLDLQKVFDTVENNMLCNKLKFIDIRPTKWFESYLGIRRKLVSIGKTNSDSAAVTFDVHQVCILGPLLFLCYVNDMMISIDPDSNFYYMLVLAQSCFLTEINTRLQIN